MTQIGAQLYTVREFTKTPEDYAVTLKKVKEIGYDAVQVSGGCKIEAEKLGGMLQDNGLVCAATHISFEEMQEDLDKVIANHKALGCKYVGIGGLPGKYRQSAEGFVTFAREATEVGKKLADAGQQFLYHNHHFEFIRLDDGRRGMDILYEETDPEFFKFEIDTFWVQTAGGDPIDWIRKMKGRMEVVHFKDMRVSASEIRPIMSEVGEGNLNWPGIIEACRDNGMVYHLVEQDVCLRNPFESLRISLENLHKLGLK